MFHIENIAIIMCHSNVVSYIFLFISQQKCMHIYNPKSEKVGTVWKTQIKKESSDF